MILPRVFHASPRAGLVARVRNNGDHRRRQNSCRVAGIESGGAGETRPAFHNEKAN
jgi:hypothetical protein